MQRSSTPSSQRRPGPVSTLRLVCEDKVEGKVKMEPGVRRDDDREPSLGLA